jgi:polyisoprenyl-teichoic acid--peptidoglycan teichoic acid transferase
MAKAQLPYAAGTAPSGPTDEPPIRARATALRIFAGMFLLLAIAGAATVIIVDNEVGGLVNAFKKTATRLNVSSKVLAPTYRGGPQTLLLVGTDQRKPPHQGPEAVVLPHSNEMLLVRIDPNKPTISMLSIPRELSVSFTTPYGELRTEERFNSAYTFGWLDSKSKHSVSGGIQLMLETIRKTLGLRVNHVFVIDFRQFEHAIEEIGCVYFPVDKRYYHNNQEPGAEQYFEIKLEPGYQNLCGEEALEYVANRHESTSIVRDDRDQRFVLEVKKQYGGRLFAERERFEHILGKDLDTTLKGGEEEILNLLYLLIESTGRPVRQVHFPLTSEGFSSTGSAVDTATPQQIHQAVASFLGGTRAVSHRRVANALRTAKQRKKRSAAIEPSMSPTSEEALDHARQLAPNLKFPLEYPRIRNATAGAEPDELRLYKLHSPNRVGHPSYVIVIDRGLLGQYYDVEGTTWQNPPIIAEPSAEVKIGHRNYLLFYSGEHIVTIAWREYGAVYWLENTLSNNVSPRQMIEIAEETQPVDRAVHTAPIKRAKAAQSALEEVVAQNPSVSKSDEEKIAIGAGAAGLLGMLGLAVMLLIRRRELRTLRDEIAQAVALESRRSPVRR